MFDKIKLWADRTIVGEQYPTIVNNLTDAKELTNLETGEMAILGNLEGMRVTMSLGGLSLIGSLAKYLHGGSNIYPLDRRTTALAIEKLSDTLHINVPMANVTSLEFGTNFLMRHRVAEYLAKLGDLPRMKRLLVEPSSLYYKGNGKHHPKVFVLYDKMADARTKGMEYPKDLEGANLLRYEMRLNGRLPYQLNVPEVVASTLYQSHFYRTMVKLYQREYFSITKINQTKTNVMDDIKTVSDAFNLLVARLINQSDPNQICGFIKELKEAGVFTDRNYYSRLKRKIHEVASMPDFTITDELIKELDDEIKNCGAYV